MKRIQTSLGATVISAVVLLCGIQSCKPSTESAVKGDGPNAADGSRAVLDKTIFDPAFINKIGSYSLLMPVLNNPLANKELCTGGMVAVSMRKASSDLFVDIMCPSIAERERQLIEAIADATDANLLRDSYSYDVAGPLRSYVGTTKNYKRTIQLSRAQDGLFVGCKSASCRLNYGAAGNCELALSINASSKDGGHPIAKTSSKCALGTTVRSIANFRSRNAQFAQPAVQSQIDKVSAVILGLSPLGNIAAMELGVLDNSGKTEFAGYVTSTNGELGAWIIDPFSYAP